MTEGKRNRWKQYFVKI